jgi:hypothetical protein
MQISYVEGYYITDQKQPSAVSFRVKEKGDGEEVTNSTVYS